MPTFMVRRKWHCAMFFGKFRDRKFRDRRNYPPCHGSPVCASRLHACAHRLELQAVQRELDLLARWLNALFRPSLLHGEWPMRIPFQRSCKFRRTQRPAPERAIADSLHNRTIRYGFKVGAPRLLGPATAPHLDGQRRNRRRNTAVNSCRGPRPVRGASNEARTNRVQLCVTQCFPKMNLIEWAGVVAPLPYVPAGAIRRIPVAGEPAVCLLQSAGQAVLLARHDHQVNMVRHKAIADQLYCVTLQALLKQTKIDAPLGVRFKNEPPRIPGAASRDGGILRLRRERIVPLFRPAESVKATNGSGLLPRTCLCSHRPMIRQSLKINTVYLIKKTLWSVDTNMYRGNFVLSRIVRDRSVDAFYCCAGFGVFSSVPSLPRATAPRRLRQPPCASRAMVKIIMKDAGYYRVPASPHGSEPAPRALSRAHPTQLLPKF